jgi:CheY-like chemotaxis protein
MATVLIVEDNAANLALAVVLLQSVGHTVLTAVDAEAGLTLAAKPIRYQDSLATIAARVVPA